MNKEEEFNIKERIFEKEAKEARLIRELRAVRGEIEGLRGKLEER